MKKGNFPGTQRVLGHHALAQGVHFPFDADERGEARLTILAAMVPMSVCIRVIMPNICRTTEFVVSNPALSEFWPAINESKATRVEGP